MKINSEELAEYVRAVLEGVCKGVSENILDSSNEPETFSLTGPVKFQVGITNSIDAKGELKIFVVGLGGAKSTEQHARIEFEVSNQQGRGFLETADKLASIWAKLPEQERNSFRTMGNNFLQAFAAQNSSVKKPEEIHA